MASHQQSAELNPTQKVWAAALEQNPEPATEALRALALAIDAQIGDTRRLANNDPSVKHGYDVVVRLNDTQALQNNVARMQFGLPPKMEPHLIANEVNRLITWRRQMVGANDPVVRELIKAFAITQAMELFAPGCAVGPSAAPSSRSR